MTRTLKDLIDEDEDAWPMVQAWIDKAENSVEVLPRIEANGTKALLQLQVTSRSPMGAIVLHSGGILIDGGWIRILGSGSPRMERSLPQWNAGKTFSSDGQRPEALLVGDDAIGGFFGIDGGALGVGQGRMAYLAPDTLEWEDLGGMGYSQFICWTLSSNVEEYYSSLRWPGWREEVSNVDGDHVINFYPPPWVSDRELSKRSRRVIPIEEGWALQYEVLKEISEKF